jgi:hypothetical protein
MRNFGAFKGSMSSMSVVTGIIPQVVRSIFTAADRPRRRLTAGKREVEARKQRRFIFIGLI